MISTYILIIVIGFIYPSYIVLTYRKVNNRIKNNGEFRLVDYKQTIIIFWILTVLIILNLFLDNNLQLNFYPTLNTIGIITTVLIVLFIGLLIAQPKVKAENASAIKDKMIDGYHYLPKTRHEFIWFNFLSLSAGICEEIIFRLFVFSFLLNKANLTTAFILTNVIFALTHIGTGRRNIISAFILGLLFTAIYYFTNNIWLPIILHSAIDIYGGTIGYKTEKAIITLRENTRTTNNV
jgi:membrane protease YdiL (CAAX protease family)